MNFLSIILLEVLILNLQITNGKTVVSQNVRSMQNLSYNAAAPKYFCECGFFPTLEPKYSQNPTLSQLITNYNRLGDTVACHTMCSRLGKKMKQIGPALICRNHHDVQHFKIYIFMRESSQGVWQFIEESKQDPICCLGSVPEDCQSMIYP